MSAVSLRLPDSIHRRIREMAEVEGVSINQIITSALVEKLSALHAEEYLAKRAGRGTRAKFDAVLAKVRDTKPVVGDELPEAVSSGGTSRATARATPAQRKSATRTTAPRRTKASAKVASKARN